MNSFNSDDQDEIFSFSSPVFIEEEAKQVIPKPYKLQKHFSEIFINEGETVRRLSLPESNARRQISHYVLIKIMEMDLDYNLANVILDSMDDKIFTVEHQNVVLNMVVERVMEAQIIVTNKFEGGGDTFKGKFLSLLGIKRSSSINQEEHKEMEDSLLKIDCPICYCSYDPSEVFTVPECEHTFCRQCFAQNLKTLIMSSETQNIKCPNHTCLQRISDDTIKTCIEPDLYNKMLKFRKIKALSDNPNIRFCPKPDCELYAQRKDNEDIVGCQCGQQICFKCGNEAHKGRSCQAAQDKSFKQAIKQYKIYTCPSCKSRIQKNEGCNHMTCQHCRYEFCWLCRQKYSHRHYEAYNFCGCPGMQYASMDPFMCPSVMRVMIFVLAVILAPVALALGVALGFVGLVFSLPALIYCNSSCYDHTVHEKVFVVLACILGAPISLVIILVGIALGLVVGVICGIPYLGYIVIDKCCC